MVEAKGSETRELKLEKINPQFDALKSQLLNFTNAIDGREKLEVTAEDGLDVMVLLDKLYKQTKKQGLVTY